MRISSRSKATALLLLVSLQYSFAVVDVALCSTALCYPKVTGAKYGAVSKSCPSGFEMGEDKFGKQACIKRVAKPCPAGTTLKDGKCCGASGTTKSCSEMTGNSCPDGLTATKDCPTLPGHPLLGHTRKMMTFGGADNPLVKEVNIVGTTVVPNLVLPKPAISINVAPPKPATPPKINMPSMIMPQLILPEPPITFSVPQIPKVGPEIKFEGNPNIIPNIIPILPEPPVTIDVPKDAFPSALPKINTDLSQRVVTVDLSKVGPAHTLDVNLPAIPNVIHEVTKLPDIDVHLPDAPRVIDLSGLGPKTSLDVKLPDVKLPKQGSVTFVNSGANVPQYIDLTGLGPKNQTGFNIKLPSTKSNGAVVNVILDDHDIKDITIPGNGGKHSTIINVPDFKETPEKKAHLVLDVKANPAIHDMLENLPKKNVTKISVAMPDIDLSKVHPDGPDVVVDIKPLFVFNHTKDVKPVPKTVKRIDIEMKDIEIPRLINDTTFVIKPKPINITHLEKFLPKFEDDKTNATTVTINLPEDTLGSLPIPEGATNVGVHLPLKFGLVKNANRSSEPDAVVDLLYTEEWVGGNKTLPNPGSKVVNAIGAVANAVTTAACPTKCCKEVAAETCQDQEFTVEVVYPDIECEKGCTYDLKADKCLCSAGTVSDCPAGLTKCSINGKGVCAPSVEGKLGVGVCDVFKHVCSKAGILAKSCN